MNNRLRQFQALSHEWRLAAVPIILVGLVLFLSCREKEQPAQIHQQAVPTPAVARPKIVAFGDSLTAGLGLVAEETYPAQLQKMLERAGYQYEVVNAGVSGDTSAGGLRRIDWVMDAQVKYVILELGANDILRGQPVADMKENLARIIKAMQEQGATVILAGMEAPTNSGPEYRKEVHDAYLSLAETYRLPFIPFILTGIAGSDNLNQEDLSHPNAKGAQILARNVFDVLGPLLGDPK